MSPVLVATALIVFSSITLPSKLVTVAAFRQSDGVLLEKTIKAVATNTGDMNEAVGGWDFTSSP